MQIRDSLHDSFLAARREYAINSEKLNARERNRSTIRSESDCSIALQSIRDSITARLIASIACAASKRIALVCCISNMKNEKSKE